MIDHIKVEGGRVHNDGPTPRVITNQGPDPVFVGGDDVSVLEHDQVVKADETVTIDGERWLVSAGRSRLLEDRPDAVDLAVHRSVQRVEKFKDKQSSSSSSKSTAKKPAAKSSASKSSGAKKK